LVIAVVVAPVGYGAGGVWGLLGGLLLGLLGGFWFGLVLGLGFGFWGGLWFGLGRGPGAGLGPGLWFGLALGLTSGLLGGLLFERLGGLLLGLLPRLLGGLALGLWFGLAAGRVLGPGAGLAAGLAVLVGVALGWVIGRPMGRGSWPGIEAFAAVWPYLKAMALPGVGFALGYAVIVLWFAGLFGAVLRLGWGTLAGDHTGVPFGTSFGDLLYFSVASVSGVGFSDLKPASALTRAMAVAAWLSGTTWLVVVFAGVLAYLQKPFAAIAAQRRAARAGTGDAPGGGDSAQGS
jgi:hypothetical protein